MYLPTTRQEAAAAGKAPFDIILVTGDTYIDSPFVGVAVIGKVLAAAGYRVGIIAQPALDGPADITRLGEPALFWGVTAGCIDSMVANRTASGRRRKRDDYTPGGVNDRRPDRATIAYSNLIRHHFKDTRPIVLGGIEASLRRVAHYDYWSDKIRKSVLFDAKADYLVYGMAERCVVELAAALKADRDPTALRGLCYIAREKPAAALELPPFDRVKDDPRAFTEMFHGFYRNNDPVTAQPIAQRQDSRYLVQNPPAPYLSQGELDAVYDLDYERDVHPFYGVAGPVRALDTIRFSIATHRGCYGECNFCAIAVHQGRTVRWRSERSILAEARAIAALPQFKGTIQDVGGPTANMYGFECTRKDQKGGCTHKRCLYPKVCGELGVDHERQLKLLRQLRRVAGVKRVIVASGIRHDLVLADTQHGDAYLEAVVAHHVSGQMKIAPEHTEAAVLAKMGKPAPAALLKFHDRFCALTRRAGKDQYLTYYLIAAHPGCSEQDMRNLGRFCAEKLNVTPEQVQLFTPTPSTYSSLMYWTERDPFTGEPCFVEKSVHGRERQKEALRQTPHR